MTLDREGLYLQMARMRHFEKAIADLWRRGLISGEMHLGTGEEGIVAGVLTHLGEGDALALDHRSTPPLVACGVDLRSIILELLGDVEGLCRGNGGHMHLLAPDHLAASSGIVGAAAPLACGFAISAQHLRAGKVAVAFFGEGAMNQGMLLESLNLAVVWNLPAIFVCKDNGFAITTRSRSVTAGSLLARARAFGMPASRVDGANVEAVWKAAGPSVERARRGGGPSFILARCSHLEGHFLGDPLGRVFRQPMNELRAIAPPLVEATRRSPGARMARRLAGLVDVGRVLLSFAIEQYGRPRDPLKVTRRRLPRKVAAALDTRARHEVEAAVAAALDRYMSATMARVGERQHA